MGRLRTALVSAGAMLLLVVCLGEKPLVDLPPPVVVSGSGFLYFLGNRIAPPWNINVFNGRLYINGLAPPFPAYPGEEGLYIGAQFSADSMRVFHTPMATRQRRILDLYRSNGYAVTATVGPERTLIPERPSGSFRFMNTKIMTLRFPDGQSRRVLLDYDGDPIDRTLLREFDYWGPLARLEKHLRDGDGVILNNPRAFTVVPRQKVSAVGRAIEGYRAGVPVDPAIARWLSKSDWDQIRSPAQIRNPTIGVMMYHPKAH